MVEKAHCSKCNMNVEVDVIDIDYNSDDCFMKITCKCKTCGEIITVKINQ